MKKLLIATALVMIFLPFFSPSAEAGDGTQTYRQVLVREGKLYMTPGQSWRWLPGDECSRWIYKGLSKKDKGNGKDLSSVRSRIDRKYFHTYKVAKSQGLNSKGQCTK